MKEIITYEELVIVTPLLLIQEPSSFTTFHSIKSVPHIEEVYIQFISQSENLISREVQNIPFFRFLF